MALTTRRTRRGFWGQFRPDPALGPHGFRNVAIDTFQSALAGLFVALALNFAGVYAQRLNAGPVLLSVLLAAPFTGALLSPLGAAGAGAALHGPGECDCWSPRHARPLRRIGARIRWGRGNRRRLDRGSGDVSRRGRPRAPRFGSPEGSLWPSKGNPGDHVVDEIARTPIRGE